MAPGQHHSAIPPPPRADSTLPEQVILKGSPSPRGTPAREVKDARNADSTSMTGRLGMGWGVRAGHNASGRGTKALLDTEGQRWGVTREEAGFGPGTPACGHPAGAPLRSPAPWADRWYSTGSARLPLTQVQTFSGQVLKTQCILEPEEASGRESRSPCAGLSWLQGE